MPATSTIADHLRAYAKLYERMAEETWSEELGAVFRRLAHECLQAASDSANEGPAVDGALTRLV
jgi:hypothetical protein